MTMTCTLMANEVAYYVQQAVLNLLLPRILTRLRCSNIWFVLWDDDSTSPVLQGGHEQSYFSQGGDRFLLIQPHSLLIPLATDGCTSAGRLPSLRMVGCRVLSLPCWHETKYPSSFQDFKSLWNYPLQFFLKLLHALLRQVLYFYVISHQ